MSCELREVSCELRVARGMVGAAGSRDFETEPPHSLTRTGRAGLARKTKRKLSAPQRLILGSDRSDFPCAIHLALLGRLFCGGFASVMVC